MSAVRIVTSPRACVSHSSSVRTLWPTSRPMSHRNVRKRLTGSSARSDASASSTSRSMSDSGCSSPRPYPPTATRSVSSAIRCAKCRHDAMITSSTIRARSRTSVSIGSLARNRAFSDSSAAASAPLNAATGSGPARAAASASRSIGGAAETEPPVDSSGAVTSAPAVLRAESQHLMAVLGHEHGVLPLRGQGVILGHDRSAVREPLHLAPAGVDPRLAGEPHAGQHHDGGRRPGARLAVVQRLRVLVELPADAVPAVLADHREPVLLDEALDRVADVPDPVSGADGLDAAPHRLVADPAQPLADHGRLADVE